MLKIKLFLPILLILSIVMSGTVFANTEDPQVEADTDHNILYLPLVFKPPLPAPPEHFSTSWYVTMYSMNSLYNKGLAAGELTKLRPGRQDQLVILDFGQPWGKNNQYGTLLLLESRKDSDGDWLLTSTAQIETAVRNYITGFIVNNDGESKLDIGIGTTNFNLSYYQTRICLSGFFCGTEEPYKHGKAWALMVKNVYNWVVEQGYANQVSIAGAIDIELSWNSPTVSHAWANGFNDYDQGVYIYYNFGTCEGCDSGINLSIPPDPDKDLTGDWTPRLAHYSAWGISPAWPIPEIYSNNGVLANQWANLSKVGVDIGYSKMYFLSAMTQMQACDGSDDWSCPQLDNTPVEAWYQLYNAINARPETAQSTIPYMTDIDWP